MTIRKRERLVLPLWAVLLVLPPLAVLFVGYQLQDLFGWQEPIADIQTKATSARHEGIGRTRVLASLLPFMVAATMIAAWFVREFLWLLGSRSRGRLWIAIATFGAAAIFFMAPQLRGISPADASVLGKGFFAKAFENAQATSGGMNWAVDLTGETVVPVAILHVLVFVFSVFLTIGAGSAIVGTISCVAKPPRTRPRKTRRFYHDMQRARIDGYLYASAFLLVSGLFFMEAAHRWPAAYAADRALFMQHVDALVLYNGILYSLVLVAYYLPAAMLMRRFSAHPEQKTAAADGQPSTVAERVSPSRLIKAFLALIAPAVAGVLSQLMEGAGL
jgi:hypothetical protein